MPAHLVPRVISGLIHAATLVPPPVKPIITLESSIVVVKKPITKPARKKVTVQTDVPFARSGALTRSNKKIRFFTAAVGGGEIVFNGKDNVFTGVQLTAGHILFAEGAK